MSRPLVHAAAAAGLAAMLGCGGGSGSPSSPSPPPVSGSPGPSGATITIANGNVDPRSVQITVGQSVTFVNNDSRGREMSSDPHPVHTDCPQINALGNIPVGATRQTNAFPTPRTCGFHDHNDPDNPGLRGTIVIQ